MASTGHLESALDPEAIESRLVSSGELYRTANPFPHIVIDDFLPLSAAERLLKEFPPPSAMESEDQPGEERRVGKYRSSDRSALSDFTLGLLRYISSPSFIAALERMSGIAGLVPDPDIDGALRHFRSGGRLALHLDSSWHGGLEMHRRVNLLYYLNKNWRDEWNGALELWDEQDQRCGARIAPLFNRAVIFPATDRTLHGFPEPLRCPPEVTRKSLQLYYYTATRPAGEAASQHGTIFR